jgi:hemerythrin-like domain-containing protein
MKSRSLLLEDHRQILRVLNVLEEMAARAQRGQEPNDMDVKGVVEFMKDFGDSRHQGKEESVLFPALLQGQGQKNYRELCHLIFEHNQERTFIRRLADSMMTGKRKDFVYFASHLVRILRSHLKEEDEVLLPLMKETFSAADDERVARDMKTYDRQWQEEDLAGVLLSLDNLESKYCRKLLMAG